MGNVYQFNTEVAKKYGLAEAVFIHQVYFWCYVNEKNKRNYHDGCYWTYNSNSALLAIFDFWSKSQLQTVIKNCKDKGALFTENYSRDARDRTLSYAVTKSVKCIYEKSEMHVSKIGNANPKIEKSIKGTDSDPAVGDTVTYDDLFAEFWKVYPRKASKIAAKKAFANLKPDENLLREMLKALEWQKKSADWKKNKGQFIPHAATWLNNRRWEDEPEGDLPVDSSGKDDTYWWLDDE